MSCVVKRTFLFSLILWIPICFIAAPHFGAAGLSGVPMQVVIQQLLFYALLLSSITAFAAFLITAVKHRLPGTKPTS